jgi:hypothetical protein
MNNNEFPNYLPPEMTSIREIVSALILFAAKPKKPI